MMAFKQLFNGIFGHFFIRVLVILISFGLFFVVAVLPYFDHIAEEIAVEQGYTLSNSTLAATTNALYTKNYPEVIDYCMRIVNGAPNILFMVYSKKDGEELVIHADKWRMEEKTFTYYQYQFQKNANNQYDNQSYIITEVANGFGHENEFNYSYPIKIGKNDWGTLTIGFSKAAYVKEINAFYLAVIVFTLLASLLGAYLFYLSSRKVRAQIGRFEGAAQRLVDGDLSARAPTNAIGEVGSLGRAMNVMSDNLQEKSTRLAQLVEIVEQTNDAVILFDHQLNIIFVNDAVEQQTQYKRSDFLGLPVLGLSKLIELNLVDFLTDIEWVSQHKTQSHVRDVQVVSKNKDHIDVAINIQLIKNKQGDAPNFLLLMTNIAKRKLMEKELYQLAYYDNLTDLPNRRMFIDAINQRVTDGQNQDRPFTLFFIDIDNFKFINDSLGHKAGDLFLVQVANRLKSIFRENDFIARLGGDEFTVLLENTVLLDQGKVSALADHLVQSLAAEPILISGRDITLNASVGVANFPEHGGDSETLLRHADTAMYVAKKQGKNGFAIFSEEMNEILTKRIELENDIKEAIALGGQIILHYQPIIDAQTEEIVAVEALARWEHPTKGRISPLDFITVAEESDLIIELSDYLTEIAFKQASEWQAKGCQFYLSVNISVRDFKTARFVQKIEGLLSQYNVNPAQIQLEFTESIMLDSSPDTFQKVNKMKAMGFIIAIDDFGTGYSSLGYIDKLPIDVIKLDKSFIDGMLENKKSNAIVMAITTLSNTLDLKTIAEGVETEVQAQHLKSIGCQYIQGWLYSPAIPADDLEKKYPIRADVT